MAIRTSSNGLSSPAVRLALSASQPVQRWMSTHSPSPRTEMAIGSMRAPHRRRPVAGAVVVDVLAGEARRAVVAMGCARGVHRHVEAALGAAEGLGTLVGAPAVVVGGHRTPAVERTGHELGASVDREGPVRSEPGPSVGSTRGAPGAPGRQTSGTASWVGVGLVPTALLLRRARRRRRASFGRIDRSAGLGGACAVEIWSDVACPWCYVGTRRFERAVEESGVDVDVVYRSFELDPSAPTGEDSVPLVDYLERKFGDRSRVQAAHARLDRRGGRAGHRLPVGRHATRQHLRRPSLLAWALHTARRRSPSEP